jgi:hypothetical protein
VYIFYDHHVEYHNEYDISLDGSIDSIWSGHRGIMGIHVIWTKWSDLKSDVYQHDKYKSQNMDIRFGLCGKYWFIIALEYVLTTNTIASHRIYEIVFIKSNKSH